MVAVMQIPKGAWFPLAFGAVVLFVSYVWCYGASQRFAYSKRRRTSLGSLISPDSHKYDKALLWWQQQICWMQGALRCAFSGMNHGSKLYSIQVLAGCNFLCGSSEILSDGAIQEV